MRELLLFPLFDPGKHFVKRSWLLPGVFTALIAVILASFDAPGIYFKALALYISGALYFFIYLFCHERKRFWVGCVVAFVTYEIVASPFLGFLLLPFRSFPFSSGDPEKAISLGIPARFVYYFFAAGLAEEFIKSLPVFFCLLLGRGTTRLAHAFGIHGPLDGILIGAASGIGFSLIETLGQYVPEAEHTIISQFHNVGLSDYAGLTLMIPRLLGNIFGHMAWSGYFGYFIGLASLRLLPTWRVLLVGWLSAALLHTLWDAFGAQYIIAGIVVSCLAYCCLAAAILEGRRLHVIVPPPLPSPVPKSVRRVIPEAPTEAPASATGTT